jgi:DNA-binding MarR family transcriptional regulator
MTGTMNNICIAVALEEGVSQDTIARKLKMDKSSVAKIVTKAVKEGYLTR